MHTHIGHDSSESSRTAPASTSGLDEKSSGQGPSQLSNGDSKDQSLAQAQAAKPAAEEAACPKGANPTQVTPCLPTFLVCQLLLDLHMFGM